MGRKLPDFDLRTTIPAGTYHYFHDPAPTDLKTRDCRIAHTNFLAALGVTALEGGVDALTIELEELKGYGWAGETVKELADLIVSEIADLAGAGRTVETVKGNADALAAIAAYANTYAEASRDSKQAIATETETVIIFDDEVSDPGGNYNAATGIYTVPSTGLYFIAGLVSSDDAAWTNNQTWRLSLNIGGVQNLVIGYGVAMGSVTVGLRANGSIVKQLTAGDLVGLSIYHPRASTNTRGFANATWFIIRRIA